MNGRTCDVCITFHRAKNGVRSGIRTHAPEETGALNQRLRPLGHPNTAYVKSGSPGMDSNHRPRDRCCGYTIYSPPLYQLSYRELTLLGELVEVRGISSIGRVRRSQRRGTGIETRILHCFCISNACKCLYSLVVRTPLCGSGNPGSNPGTGIFCARLV